MKQAFAILFSLTIGLAACNQRGSIRGEQFQLTGKIVGTVHPTAACGFDPFATVIEFEVEQLVGMSYSNKRIGIIITCPDSYGRNFFETGKSYQIIFSDKNQADFEWIISNKDLLKKNGLSFDPYAVKVKKVP